jgi:hypothetical protein
MSVLSSGLILAASETESFPQDDIDRLFEKLHKLEPPEDIVKQILARVKRLPAPFPQTGEKQSLNEKKHEAAE